ncbi:MAG: hypothetical protein H3C53_01135 [Trueperaceae bacterium]|nr:hypothetical protein [Trueperaceae bacterium]
MWIYSLDDRVLNTALLESMEVVETFPDDVAIEDIEATIAEPDFYEVVAIMSSGDEALLYSCEDQDEAYVVYDLLATILARGTFRDGSPVQAPISVLDLLDRERQAHN